MTSPVVSATVHRAWLLTMRPAARAFDRAWRDPSAAQRDLLARLIERHRDSVFGLDHGFASIRSVDDFRAAVPVRTYDDLLPWIDRAQRGEPRVLTSERVVVFEQTSGSSGAAKLIPYTSSLRAEFERALAPWMCDLYDHDATLMRGPAYWAVTPIARARTRTQGGVPIGFDDDTEYFGRVSGWFAKRLLAVPREVARAGDMDQALYLTLRFLLQQRSLTLLSVWNPTLLTILCQTLESRGEELARDLRAGTITHSNALPPDAIERLAARARRNTRQADIVTDMLRRGAISPLELWPALRLVSCWTSAEAAAVVEHVRRLFPGVAIQGKGLLATEAILTIPLHRRGGAVPAITSHVLEFAPVDGTGVRLVHELERGRDYLPIVTTGGGLWRYRIGDRVRVTDVTDGVPVVEFVGREDGVCDLRGEKLSPPFVGGVLSTMALPGTFAMLAPAADRGGYVLFTDATRADEDLLDRLLRANPHYAYCRDLGQLRKARVVHIAGDAQAQYLRHCERLQRRASTAKLVALDRASGWIEAFTEREAS
jgi:GH3 auxin-responsive promoter